jgi:hypothetical protein
MHWLGVSTFLAWPEVSFGFGTEGSLYKRKTVRYMLTLPMAITAVNSYGAIYVPVREKGLFLQGKLRNT